MWLTRLLLERRCPLCDGLAWPEQPVCAPCWGELDHAKPRRLDALDAVYASRGYSPEIAGLILRAKDDPDRALLRFLGRQLAAMWNAQAGGPTLRADDEHAIVAQTRPSSVVWVPATTRNRRQRGFDQGQELARVFAGATGLPLRHGLRRRDGRHGFDRPRARRASRSVLEPRGPLSGAVVLIDDVIVTGATISDAASILRAAGASHIVGMAIASADSSSSGA